MMKSFDQFLFIICIFPMMASCSLICLFLLLSDPALNFCILFYLQQG
ncbi:hypothetical protein V6Z12_A07G155900 [Gossypium hirsutum]